MAMGVMLGMLAGLLEFTRLRPTMSPVQLTRAYVTAADARGARDCSPIPPFRGQTSALARMGRKV